MLRPSARRLRALGITTVLLLATGCSAVQNGTGVAAPQPSPTTSGPTRPVPAVPSAQAAPTQQPATFTTCDRLNLRSLPLGSRKSEVTISCARIDVPLDYADPTGQTIPLELIKIHDTKDAAPTGSLIMNPGGPGASGIFLALGVITQVSENLLTHFDLIGFDPRGVSLSSPIHCVSDHEKSVLFDTNDDIRTATGFAQAKASAQQVAAECSAKYGAALAQYNTVNTARDMDQIRQAVGDAQMNYLGFSYGTELGAQYAHLFPSLIRVAVLDGAVNPLTDDLPSFANQLKGFEGAFDQFAAHCATTPACASLGNPRQVVYDLVSKADQSPLKTSAAGDTRTAGGAIVLTGVLQALYSQSLWASLATALKQAQAGDAKGLFALADEYNERFDNTYTNIYDANLTIACDDSKPGPTDAVIRSTAQSWATTYPMFGIWSAQSLFACQSWQPVRTVPPLPTAPTAHKVLVIGNLHDPATPYQGAIDLARTMGNAEVLSWDGEGHTSYLQGSSCVDNYVDAYLISGTLPPPNTKCPA